jgi:hypothetical protein
METHELIYTNGSQDATLIKWSIKSKWNSEVEKLIKSAVAEENCAVFYNKIFSAYVKYCIVYTLRKLDNIAVPFIFFFRI